MARRLADDHFSTRLQWLFILALFLLARGLGIAGFMQAHPPAARPWTGLWSREILDNFYRTLILFTMNTAAEATNQNGLFLAARLHFMEADHYPHLSYDLDSPAQGTLYVIVAGPREGLRFDFQHLHLE